MIIALHIVFLCRFTLRSYAANVLPVSYSWSTFTGPVSGHEQQVESPWRPSSSPYATESAASDDENDSYGPDYVAKPDYSFAYGVENPNTGDRHGHSETRDGSTVTGEYSVMEPDGVLRRVLYTSDPKNGFRASVRFVRPDGESSDHDHGYRGGIPESSSSHDESDGDGPYAPRPPSPSHFGGYDGYYNDDDDDHSGLNNVNDDDNNNDDNRGDDYDQNDGVRSPFGFPSPTSPVSKPDDADSNDYGGNDKYYHWDSFGSPPTPFDGPPSSPSPFSPSSSLRFGPSSSSPPSVLPSHFFDGQLPSSPFFDFPERPSPTARPPFTVRPPSPSSSSSPPLSADVAIYPTYGHSYGFGRRPEYVDHEDDNESFLHSLGRLSGQGDGDDDNDTDTTDVAVVELSAKSVRPRQLSVATESQAGAPLQPSPLRPSPFRSSPTMTPIEPIIIDIDVNASPHRKLASEIPSRSRSR